MLLPLLADEFVDDDAEDDLAKTLGLVKVADAPGAAITLHAWIYRAGFSWIGDPTLRSHAFALVTILFWWAVLRVFEKKGWYWTV